MIWGLSESTFTTVHTVLSLIGIGSGLVVMFGFLTGKERGGWTLLFLVTTVATCVTGFAFPFDRLLPAHKVGIVSLVVLAVAIVARYALQTFMKVPALNALAPHQTEAPFVMAQVVVLALFIGLTIAAAKRARGDLVRPAP